MEDIVVFIGLKLLKSDNYLMFSSHGNAQIIFEENPHLKIILFKVINIDFYIVQTKVLKGFQCESGIAILAKWCHFRLRL